MIIEDSIFVSLINLMKLIDIMGIVIGSFFIVGIVMLPAEGFSVDCLFDWIFLHSCPVQKQ